MTRISEPEVLLVIGIFWGIWGWLLLTLLETPRALSWRTKNAESSRFQWIESRLSPFLLDEYRILSLTPGQLLGVGGLIGFGTALLLIVVHHPLLAPLGFGAGLWFGPQWWIQSQYQTFQRQLRQDFPTIIMLLQIYFDLNMSLLDALRRIRGALSSSGRREIDRILSGFAEDRGDESLTEWGRRSHIVEYQLLASTLIAQRGMQLRSDMLTPLNTLLNTARQQALRSQTRRLNALAVLTPSLAVFAVVILYFFSMIAHISGLSLVTHYF
ncbi:hypothetical protein TPY_2653 [Sulfobacillus acidophilus TPY]|uniref:Type II secretion system protein GspF domain-containing protein n=1 Tax=Sulfobacillus acidophilus (strain ATCC 700253 / DSM 10332 / NAL) TaxID=679936 RepID=G8TV87_SULAD|nr:hypothetical protein TPY_2653 [Sulfobacillus acidophilus TPY]AEW04727.1 hypothetical protein Sulac_1227 [Sulfobacillus acidophilus DSM 10332]